MELSQIEAFVAVTDTHSFSAAATQLHLTQPAVSRRIGQLEHALGQPMFDRLPSRVTLTDAGTAFLPFARRTLAAVQDGRAAVLASAGSLGGIVTLALVGTLAATDLTTRLKRFRDDAGHGHLKLRTALSVQVSQLVRNGTAQLGLRYFADRHDDISSEQVGDEPLVVVASGSRPTPNKTGLETILDATWVGFPASEDGQGFGNLLLRQLAAAGLGSSEVLEVDSLTAQKRMIEADFGVGLLPRSSVGEELRLGTLQVLDAPQLRASLPIHLIQRRTTYVTPLMDRLSSVLRAPATGRS
ncbi:MAG: LysR family transcriptional regulator [Nannocystales bacterium]